MQKESKRLLLLRENLQQELVSDNPSLRYIEDLKVSIEREENMQKHKFIMVNE